MVTVNTGPAPVITDSSKDGQQVVRLTVTVPIEVAVVDWELSYGIARTDAALVADIADHVHGTVIEAVRQVFADQANGARVL